MIQASRRGRARPAATPAAPEAFTSERKLVTILRADLHRSTNLVALLDPEEAIERLEPALAVMRSAVRRFGGLVWREVGDGVIAVFGAPLADSQHAWLACHASLELVAQINALRDPDIKVRIGLASGVVIAGLAEGDLAQSYELGGPTLIVADRLQASAAPGEILAAETCRTLVREGIRFAAPRDLHLKGYSAPVPAYAVLGVAAAPARPAGGPDRFVGRAEEFEAIMAAAEVAAAGQGGTMAIVGDPGVGKSRLAREAVQALHERGWRVLDVACNVILDRAPFALVRGILAAVEGLAGEAWQPILDGLPPAQRAALDSVRKGDSAAAIWQALSPRARARTIIEAVRAVALAATADRPTVLLVEDLHWADESSAAAVEAVLAAAVGRPLLVLLTARTGALPGWAARQQPRLLVLAGLSGTAVDALLDVLLGRAPEMAPLKLRIAAHTGSQPLFLHEVCRRLVETGALRGAWGDFRLVARSVDLDVPPTVYAVIAARIDRLAPAEKRLLQTAAVIGPRVARSLLDRIAAQPARVVAAGLAALSDAALLGLDDSEGGPVCVFPHELIRQVAYDALLTPARRLLHRRVLEELERRSHGGILDLHGTLAHHALLAQEWPRVAEYAETVARRCSANSGLIDAGRYFEMAIDAVDRLEPSRTREARAVDLRIASRVAMGSAGKVERWLDLAREAEARAAALGDPVRSADAMVSHASALNFIGPCSEAVQISRDAMRRVGSLNDAGRLASAEYVHGLALYQTGRCAEAAAVLARAQQRALGSGVQPPGGAPAGYLPLVAGLAQALCHFARGEDAPLAAQAGFVAALAAVGPMPVGQVLAGLTQGLVLLARGADAAAAAELQVALELARQHELLIFVPLVGFHLGLARLGLELHPAALHPVVAADALPAFVDSQREAAAIGLLSIDLRSRIWLPLAAGAPAAFDDQLRAGDIARQQGFDSIAAEAKIVRIMVEFRSGTVDPADLSDSLSNILLAGADLGLQPAAAWARRPATVQ